MGLTPWRCTSDFPMSIIRISDFCSRSRSATVEEDPKECQVGSLLDCGPAMRSAIMNDLESSLNRVLEEHQHESGLHMIGGRRRLVDRLVQFFEELKLEKPEPRAGREQQN